MDDQILNYVLDIDPVKSPTSRIYLSITITLLETAQHTLFWQSLVEFDYLQPEQEITLNTIHLVFSVVMIAWFVFSSAECTLVRCSPPFLILAPLLFILLAYTLFYRQPISYYRMMILAIIRALASIFYKQAIQILSQLLVSPHLKQRYLFIMNSFSTLFALIIIGIRSFFKVLQDTCRFTLCDYSECVLIGIITGVSLLTLQIVSVEDQDVYRFSMMRYRLLPFKLPLESLSGMFWWILATTFAGIVYGYNLSCIEFSFLIDYFERYQENIYPFLFWCVGTGICEFCVSLFQSGNAGLNVYVAQIILMNAALSILQIFQNVPRYISYSILFRGAIMEYAREEYYYMNQKYWPPNDRTRMYFGGLAIIQIISILTFQLSWVYYYKQTLLENAQQIYNANFIEMIFSGGLLVLEVMAVVTILQLKKRAFANKGATKRAKQIR